MDQVLRLLGYEFAQNALAAGVVIALVCGIVSWFVVTRNMSFAVHALAELGFTGAAGAVYLGVSTVAGLLAGTFISALLIGVLGVRLRERDTVVGVIMAFGLGLGVLFLTLYPRYATQAFAILFGTITGVSQTDVVLLVGVGILTLVALAVVYRPLMFATVDPDVAAARGVPVRALGVIFLVIMAAAVAEAVQVVGVLLILTLLITPGAAAERVTASPGRAIAISVAVALLCVVGGILLSLAFNVPVSVFVTGLSFACYIVARSVIGPLAFGQRRANVSDAILS
jgi:zinc/manganese transport system permease protein